MYDHEDMKYLAITLLAGFLIVLALMAWALVIVATE